MTILHFNDVYNVEPRPKEGVKCAVRVCTVLRFQLKTWIWNLEITLWFQVKSVK